MPLPKTLARFNRVVTNPSLGHAARVVRDPRRQHVPPAVRPMLAAIGVDEFILLEPAERPSALDR